MRTELAAAPPVFQAHQPDQIRPVAVEGQSEATDLIAPNRRIVNAFVLVRHVAQHMAVLVLGPRQPQVGADAPIEEFHLGLAIGPSVNPA
jgi:hypothetical protein